ncbi:STAS domain-containing protein [Streptomyces flavofungini]|uniref:STAS domain-containing protein n=1 Tax=Streptomyces flavofungini TaxID=68200 RepID=UPI0025B01145|nr:STAS domain-containing protein [Streptomyces flavofungini]WJV47216.1 STAS domain-containing protein [Streptomyces flavofungini]
MTPPPSVICVKEVRAHRGCTLVVLCGEIDIHTAPGIIEFLDGLTHTHDIDLLIDLRPVDFMDCGGVRLLNRARARSRSRHGRLRLICTGHATLNLLRHPRLRLDFEILSELPAPVPPRAAA